MNTPETVYDPTEIQLRSLEEAMTEKLNVTDLASPQMVQMILQREVVMLTEMRGLKAEVNRLQGTNGRLMQDRENLRIDLATAGQRESTSWIEIPISILAGFAINMLTADFKSGLGWALLILSIVVLLFLRLAKPKTREKASEDANG